MDCLPVQSFLNGGDLMPSKQVRAARVQLPVEGKTGHWIIRVELGELLVEAPPDRGRSRPQK